MNRFLQHLSIKNRLIWIIFVTSGSIVSLALMSVLAMDLSNLRKNAIHDARSKSKIMNQDFANISLFGDANRAADTSSKLRDYDSVLNVFVFDKQGDVIFSYSRSQKLRIQPPVLTTDRAYLEDEFLHVFTPIEYEGLNFGHAYMRIEPEYLEKKRQEYYVLFGIGGPALLILSYLLAVWLQFHFSQPIIALTEKMEKITSEKDYSSEVTTNETHEIGSLYRSFNSLLKTISKEQKNQKNYKEELETHRNKLEELVLERTSELNAINKELEAFSYSVSHDLRAPLRAIDGFSLALLEDYENKLDDEGKDNLLRVRRAVQRMSRLIDSLLHLSRVTRQEIIIEDVDLSNIASKSISKLQEADESRKVDRVIAKGVNAHGDSTLLELVLNNLLENAWKYTSKEIKPRIEFGVVEQGEEQVYFVKDNGIGFDMQYSKKLFGAFQRMHREADYPGTGVGLATVQRIIHRHGGRIWAESEAGGGATFFFTLGLALLPTQEA